MNLARNVGSVDKMIRLVAGALLLLWGFIGLGPATGLGLAAVIVGVVLVLTGLINFCPLFKVLGINSIKS